MSWKWSDFPQIYSTDLFIHFAENIHASGHAKEVKKAIYIILVYYIILYYYINVYTYIYMCVHVYKCMHKPKTEMHAFRTFLLSLNDSYFHIHTQEDLQLLDPDMLQKHAPYTDE